MQVEVIKTVIINDKKELEKFNSCHRVWQGIPGIVRTKGGRTFVTLYSGNTCEYYGNFAVVIKSDNDGEFGEPIVAAFREGRTRCFDPVLWIDPLDRLWFIWSVMNDDLVYASICDDPDADEIVFGEEFVIGTGIMMNKPIVLSTGEWIFPIAVWRQDCNAGIPLTDPNGSGSFVYKSTDNGKSFTKIGGVDVPGRTFDEHMIVEKANGVLWMLVRCKGGIGESYSYDRGRTWSRGQMTSLGGPDSRFHIMRLRSGRILLINHHEFTGRNNLAVFLSEDEGRTFPYMIMLDERANVSYPDAFEADDGYIYITYDRERGGFLPTLEQAYTCAREVLVAKITEEDIIKGELVDKESYLKRVASKLGRLAEGDQNPYELPLTHNIYNEWQDSKCEDPVGRLFERFALKCTGIENLEAEQLDKIIEQFNESGRKDEKLFSSIIDLINKASEKENGTSPIIDAAKAYIEKNIAEDLSVADIAKELRISVYYLAHLFKAITGITVTEFRNEYRLTRAKYLLCNTDKSVGDIATEVGFGGASYFAEVFTRNESVPPSEYRKYHSK